jgi:hypothetical protein
MLRAFPKIAAGVGLSLALAVPAVASPVTFAGFDAGAGSLATAPTATAAAAAFNAATGGLPVINFESSLPAGVSISGLNVTNSSGCPNPLCGYNTTSGGSMFDLVVGGSITFNFTSPIDSFGAYFTGWQVNGQTLSYGSTTLTMPNGDFSNGGTLFFGFVDAGASITSITYSALNDIVAVDDVRYGRSGAAVPEPTSLLLLGTGLAGLVRFARKRA